MNKCMPVFCLAHVEINRLHKRMMNKLGEAVLVVPALDSKWEGLRIVSDGKIIYPFLLSFPM